MTNTLRSGRRRRNNKLNHLELCFTNFINPFIHDSPPPPPLSSPSTSSSSPLHHHHHIDHNRPSPSTTTKSIINNFNTPYHSNNTSSLYPQPEPEPADFATAFASQRFFFSSPGRSNSIVESTAPSTTSNSSPSSSPSQTANLAPPPDTSSAAINSNKKDKLLFFDGSVAVSTYSPDPYIDFRQSMQEMVEARPELMIDVKSKLDVLQELLLCYLELNPKSTHKFILGAFADLLVSLIAFSSSSSCRSLPPPENQNSDEGAGGGGC